MRYLIEIYPSCQKAKNKRLRRFSKKIDGRRYQDYKNNADSTSMLLSFFQERFARDLAHTMNDLKSLLQYRKFVHDIPIHVLEDIKEQVLSKKDIKNRGAYFTTLVQLYKFEKADIKPISQDDYNKRHIRD